jgi:hypothetical protein
MSQSSTLTVLFCFTTIHIQDSLKLVQDAYLRLTQEQLILFLKIRNLPTAGSRVDLASRLARHDLHTYHFHPGPHTSSSSQSNALSNDLEPLTKRSGDRSGRSGHTPQLPIEIVATILDLLDDWALSKAVGVPTSLIPPLGWNRATTTDYVLLTGDLPRLRTIDLTPTPPTQLGAAMAVRFGYLPILEYILAHDHSLFLALYKNDVIPIKASRYGRINVLAWWKHAFEHHPELVPPPKEGSIAEAIDSASRGGRVISLDWWFDSGLPFEYTEEALEQASAKGHLPVLDWWHDKHKNTGLNLKIGRVMDMASSTGHVKVLEWWATSQLVFRDDRLAMQHASCNGKVEVLQWWLDSGLPLHFDQDALTGATRHNRAEVLEWWDRSGLPIQYRMCDIEEALEDARGGGQAARRWWEQKGLDFNANDREWMKLQNLN